MAAARGTVVLMGSGEFTATMVEVHKELLGRVGEAPRAVFLDTPAGFQLNVDDISRKAAEYFRSRVQRDLGIASLKSAEDEPVQAERAYQTLRQSDYVLVGPGSPTYAVRQWQRTPVPDILAERIRGGACLVAASAAALTMGKLTVPVYEIYKVGEEPRWAEGLDLLGRFGLDAVVIPHWNNAEGGTHDTRFCYLGEPRFRAMEAMLPAGMPVLGVDEHTACLVDLARQTAEVRGIGRVTIRRNGAERSFGKNDTFSLEAFRGEGVETAAPMPSESPRSSGPADDVAAFWSGVRSAEASFHEGMERRDAVRAVTAVLDLDRLVWSGQSTLGDEAPIAQGRELLRETLALLGAWLADLPGSAEECLGPVVEGVLDLRARWRGEGRWADADVLRACLEENGIAVEDTREGFRWRVRG